MATVFKVTLTVSADQKSYLITDITGTGATGWNGANTPVAEITEGTVLITAPNIEPVTIDIFNDGTPAPGSLTPGFIVLIGTSVVGADSNGNIKDGFATVVVTLGPETFIANDQTFNVEGVCCCVKKLQDKDYEIGCGCGGSGDVTEGMYAYQLLRNINASYGAGKANRATMYLKELQLLCNKNKCNC